MSYNAKSGAKGRRHLVGDVLVIPSVLYALSPRMSGSLRR